MNYGQRQGASSNPQEDITSYMRSMISSRRQEIPQASEDELRRQRERDPRRAVCDNYTYISRERGSEHSSASVSKSFANNAFCSTHSTPSSISGTSDVTSATKLRRYATALYKHTARCEPNETAKEEINRFANTEPDKGNIGNETRWMERLKIHLIKQGREKESKRVVELYHKLKEMSVVKNREAIIGLMYSLFDKEYTRSVMMAKALSKKTTYTVTVNADDKNAGHVLNPKTIDVHHHASMSVNRRPLTAPNQHRQRLEEFETEDMDHAPVPRLHSSTDNLLNQGMIEDTKIPPLTKANSVFETKIKPHSNNFQQNIAANNSEKNSTRQVISKISNFPDDSSQMFLSSLESQNSANIAQHNLFSSTPMEYSDVPKHKQHINLRKLHDTQSSIGKPTSSNFIGAASGTVQTFASSKSMEKELIRDILYILQGIDGSLIKATPKGTYEISTKKFLHPSLRLQTLKLCELGFCYTKIKNYCEKSTTGLMAQGFKHAIEKELQEFYRLLAVVQGKIQQTIVDTPMSEDLPSNKAGDMTMLKLGIWLFECRPRLQVLAGMVDSCDLKKGGSLCSVIHKYSQHGDPLVANLTVSLLSTICKPLYIMLSQWILYGELEDPFNEFFIAADLACKKEQLWHLKYRIRPGMLPSFISMKQAEKILAIGKNINFLKEICNNAEGYEGKYEIKALLESGEVECLFLDENSSIQYAIELSYKTTSEKVLKVLIDDSKLLDHLNAIKKYLLLGQGDFIQYFLELIQDELSKPASKLYNHNISAILESAVRATNSQFENEDILSRLDTRILPTSDKDVGWDVFCLDYKAYGPIGTVLTEDVMNGYNKLFNSLWRTKRIEIILSTLWKNQTVLFKYLRLIPELAPVLHRSQLLISEMIHFVHQTQYYIMFEATECAWEKLMDDVKRSSDLDEVIAAHKKFLDTIFKRSLLDLESRELLNQLRGIFDSVYELRGFLHDFNERVEIEVNLRKNIKPNTGEIGLAQKQFFSSYVKEAKGKIETLYTTTQDLVRTFLLVLNRQQDLTLQCLSFRLDFNEYYHEKDSRLSQPLTFQHRRLSSNTFTPLNLSGSVTTVNTSPFVTANHVSILEASEDFSGDS